MKAFWRILGLLAAVVWVGISPAGLAAGGDVGPQPQSSSTVTIQLFQFRPSQLEVKAGTKVTWVNQDDIAHTVTSGAPESRDGRFNSRLSGKGATFDFTFTEPGTYQYFCNRHHSMQGQIRVF